MKLPKPIEQGIEMISKILSSSGGGSSQPAIVAEGEYLASNALDENSDLSRDKARIAAIKNAVAKIETVVAKVVKDRQKQIPPSRIQAIASIALKIQGSPNFETTPSADEKTTRYLCRLKFRVSESNILSLLRREPSALDEIARQNRELSMVRDRILNENQNLQQEIESVESLESEDREKFLTRRETIDKKFQATQFFERGYKSIESKKYPDAVENFSKAIELSPDYLYAYIGRGIAYKFLKKIDLAMADFDQATSIDPNYASLYFSRGAMFVELGKTSLAMMDLDRAISLNPNSAEAYYTRGTLFESKGNRNRAIADYKKTLALDPSYDKAQSSLEQLQK